MTKILVVSDSHGDLYRLRSIIDREPGAKIVFFLGDGEREAEILKDMYPNRFFHIVHGNWEWESSNPDSITDIVENCKIYACHGHTHLVKYGTADLLAAAKAEKARIALYGHTHRQALNFVDGVYLFNPGSVREGKYGVIDIAENGILPVLRNLD